MHIARVTLKSVTPYSQSKAISEEDWPKKPKELPEDYDKRCWRGRMHVSDDGKVEIPSTAFGNVVKSAARRLQIQIPGKGKTQYTKYFEAGVMVADSLRLPVVADTVPCDRLFVPSDGTPGSGRRVWRHFPRIDAWGGVVTFYILDDLIPEEVFSAVIKSAGLLVGIGRFRPENRGFYGRFDVRSIEWIDNGEAAIGG